MSQRNVLIVVGVIALLMVAQVAVPKAAESEGNLPTELKQLRDRVQQLEDRITKLEKRPSIVAVPQMTPAPSTAPLPQGRRVPENWTEHEFNGQKYYIVPLDTTGSGRPRVAIPAPTAK